MSSYRVPFRPVPFSTVLAALGRLKAFPTPLACSPTPGGLVPRAGQDPAPVPAAPQVTLQPTLAGPAATPLVPRPGVGQEPVPAPAPPVAPGPAPPEALQPTLAGTAATPLVPRPGMGQEPVPAPAPPEAPGLAPPEALQPTLAGAAATPSPLLVSGGCRAATRHEQANAALTAHPSFGLQISAGTLASGSELLGPTRASPRIRSLPGG